MKWMVALGCLMLVGCVEVSVKRVKGDTTDGYTAYKTTVHVETIDEPICHGSCR